MSMNSILKLCFVQLFDYCYNYYLAVINAENTNHIWRSSNSIFPPLSHTYAKPFTLNHNQDRIWIYWAELGHGITYILYQIYLMINSYFYWNYFKPEKRKAAGGQHL